MLRQMQIQRWGAGSSSPERSRKGLLGGKALGLSTKIRSFSGMKKRGITPSTGNRTLRAGAASGNQREVAWPSHSRWVRLWGGTGVVRRALCAVIGLYPQVSGATLKGLKPKSGAIQFAFQKTCIAVCVEDEVIAEAEPRGRGPAGQVRRNEPRKKASERGAEIRLSCGR